MTDQELVERLKARIEQSRSDNGDMLYFGKPDQLLVDCLAALTTRREAVLEEAAKAIAGVVWPDLSWDEIIEKCGDAADNFRKQAAAALSSTPPIEGG